MIFENHIFRGREFTYTEIELIRKLIKENPNITRRKLSKMICELINWRQPNGILKDRACRDVLLRMNEKGIIDLPPIRTRPRKKRKRAIERLKINFIPPITEITDLNLDSIKLRQIRGTEDEKLWDWLVDKYHYLGYQVIVGHFLKYLVASDNQIVGCIGFGDGILKLNLRDKWIGWTHEQRKRNLYLVINQRRFLILPWIKVKNLASKVLSLSVKTVQGDWQEFYGYKPILVETFVDIGKFIGTCYKAANWIYLGRTKGKGRSGRKYFVHNRPKDLYVCPLHRSCLSLLKCNPEKKQ